METFVLCKILAMKSFDLKATLFSLLFQFRKFTDQDITKNYPHEDTLVNAGRVALALTLLLSFPLLIFPCRAVINKLIWRIESRTLLQSQPSLTSLEYL